VIHVLIDAACSVLISSLQNLGHTMQQLDSQPTKPSWTVAWCATPASACIPTHNNCPYLSLLTHPLPGLLSHLLLLCHTLRSCQGLTHTGSLKCATSGNVVMRQPSSCKPDWYGDQTSFMGSGPDLQLPNIQKFKVSSARAAGYM
jgi:hypothetical protein